MPQAPTRLGSGQMTLLDGLPLLRNQRAGSLHVQSLQAVQMQGGQIGMAPMFYNNGVPHSTPVVGSHKPGIVQIQQQTSSRTQRVPSKISYLNPDFQPIPQIRQIAIRSASTTTPAVQSTPQNTRIVQTQVMPGAQAPASGMDSITSLNSTATQHYQLGNMQRSVIEGLAPPGPHNWASTSGFARRG